MIPVRWSSVRLLALAAGLAAVSAVPAVAERPSLLPAGWDADIKLAEAPDRNPDPGIVEIEIVAKLAEVEVAPGTRVTAWTYNGGLPGPLIRARVGDRLIVHFRNELEQETTIHWHGIRVPIEMDGVPGISQPPVKTGETFVYDFVVPDSGLFWYHPHVMSAAQVGYGLYGPLLVEEPDEDVGVADALTIVLSDIGIGPRGLLEPADSGGSAGMVFGREGNHVLVNGRVRPELRARAGVPQRWRIVNTAKSRFFFLDLEGQTFIKIGGDGGIQEYSERKDVVLVTAGERVDLIVMPMGEPGGEITLRSLLYNRGYGSIEYRSVEDLFTIQFTDEAPLPAPVLPEMRRAIVPPAVEGATPVTMQFTLPPVDGKGESEFRINGVPFWKAEPFKARIGETQFWTLDNQTPWDHPFHLHGYFFMPVDEAGVPISPMEWKDTLNVPMNETIRLLVTFDERPGEWMIHCHILDHADGGLMGTVLVGDVKPSSHHTHVPPR
ncbi:MAG: multicopper oxidase family protein [Vicinamibacterales bacterium]|nr:multicopper oxidase family protein [Vicinamibacterales bacterium]